MGPCWDVTGHSALMIWDLLSEGFWGLFKIIRRIKQGKWQYLLYAAYPSTKGQRNMFQNFQNVSSTETRFMIDWRGS